MKFKNAAPTTQPERERTDSSATALTRQSNGGRQKIAERTRAARSETLGCERSVQFLSDREHDHSEPLEVGSGPVASTRFGADAALAEVAEGKRTLASGATGTAVFKVQQALVDLGHLGADRVTGSFDADSVAAITAYQKAAGVPPSGVLDQSTFEKLDAKFSNYAVEGAALKGLAPSKSPTPGTPYAVGTAPAELMAGTRALSGDERDAFNDAISTGVKADSSGKLPTFKETVSGKKYGDRVREAITKAVDDYLKKAKAAKKDRDAGHTYDWGDINNVGVESKKATDASFGSYAVGEALSGGKVTSKVQDAWATKEKALGADPAVADSWAEWRVRKIITGSGSVAKIDKMHGAVQTRAAEKAILDAIAFNNTPITKGVRKAVEGPYHEPGTDHPIPKLHTYRQSANAEQGAAIIGLPNLCAGFFLGRVELIGKV